MQIISAVVLLGVLIFVHELGHFLFAKYLGVSVLKFSLGFGPRIIGKKWGETEYQLAAFPLGGFVKMLGEEPGEELQDCDKDRAFNYQPVWKRMAIVIAGPFFNIVFAAVLFSFLMMTGLPGLIPQIGEVLEDSPAQRAGIQKDDRIIEVDGISVDRWEEMRDIIHARAGKELSISVKRDDQILTFNITPETKIDKNIFGEDTQVGLIGVVPSGEVEKTSLPFFQAVDWGLKKTWWWCKMTVISIVKLIQKVIPADTLGGPLLIMQMAGQQAEQGAESFLMFMAIISINLGILNLFPIPILDGGHVVFMSIEAIRKKPLKAKTVEIAQKAGLFMILGIMVFALYNDILRFVSDRAAQ